MGITDSPKAWVLIIIGERKGLGTSWTVQSSGLILRRNPRAMPAMTPEKVPTVNPWVFKNFGNFLFFFLVVSNDATDAADAIDAIDAIDVGDSKDVIVLLCQIDVISGNLPNLIKLSSLKWTYLVT